MIINNTQSTVLATEAIHANTFFTRYKGLMFKKMLNKNSALVIYPCNCIHTFFMRFTIDVLMLDKEKRVVKIIADMTPWRISPIIKSAHYVVEFSGGDLDMNKVKIGDIIHLCR